MFLFLNKYIFTNITKIIKSRMSLSCVEWNIFVHWRHLVSHEVEFQLSLRLWPSNDRQGKVICQYDNHSLDIIT